jgi:very-short-patch-repair endonuclease
MGLLPARGRKLIDVTLRSKRERRGHLRPHTTRCQTASDHSAYRGIPITSVARTILDVGDERDQRAVEQALAQADIRYWLTQRTLNGIERRSTGRRGAPTIRAALDAHRAEPTLTESELEERFLRLVAQAGLPRPQTQVPFDPYRVDYYRPDHNLIVEADGWRTHRTRAAFERDRRKDRTLTAQGYRIVRVTWRQVERTHEAADLLDDLRRLVG